MISQQESGRSMVEMLAVLCVIGVLVAGATSGISFGMTSYKVSSVHQRVESIASGVSDLFSWRREFPTDESFGTLISKNEVCSGCEFQKNGNGAVMNDSGFGPISVQPSNYESFGIAVEEVPEDACNQLKEKQWVNAEWSEPAVCGASNTIRFIGY